MGKIILVFTLLILLVGCSMDLTQLSPDKNIRFQQIVDASNAVYGQGTVMAKLAASQAVWESHLYNEPSLLAIKYNNLFGIKGQGSNGKTPPLWTWEWKKGKVKLPFAWNKNLQDSFAQHKNLMNKDRYKDVLTANSFEEAADNIYKAGYATDQTYPDKLKYTFNTYLKDLF